MTTSSKPAQRIALASLVLSVVFFGIGFFVGRWSGFFGVYAVSWLILASALVWFVLSLQFHQRSLSEQEKLDMSQLASQKDSAAIFQAKGEQASVFAVAQRRLELLEKWFLPIFSAIIAVYLIGIGVYLFRKVSTVSEVDTKQPLVCAICMTAIAFVSFLLSRYATGMSAQRQWRPLRAGGSFMLAVAILCFVLAISLAMVQFKSFVVINVINFIIPVLLIVIGIEAALNVVLDIYRPRLKDQYGRSAFDSRLLGIINEPGGILRSAAGAIDYQFGFQVSQTWFYKLLEKAIVPLVLFAATVLYLLSCFVIVAPNEEAIIEHFGNPLDRSGEVRSVGPGLTVKWPWPVDIAYKYPTKKVAEISVGFVPKIDEKTKEPVRESHLWGRTHHDKEHQLLVASQSRELASVAVPVSFVVAAVPVQYRVKDLYSFLYNHAEPEKILESICYRELTRFAASAKIEIDEQSDIEENLLGAGRGRAKRILTDRIQKAADKARLGIEIVFLGLQGVHPPADVAQDYQKVVGAVQQKQAYILDAHSERNRTLATLAGSVQEADRLYALAAKYQQARDAGSEQESEKLGRELDEALARARGEIFKTLREAKSDAFEKVTIARATGERFKGQLKAYLAAKEIYKRQQRLAVLEEALENIRKFVIVADKDDAQVFIIDVQEKLTPSLYDLTGLEESK